MEASITKRQRLVSEGEDQQPSAKRQPDSSTSHDTTSGEAHYQESVALMKGKDYKAAVFEIGEALKTDAENVMYLIQAAYVFKGDNQMDRAAQSIDQALAIINKPNRMTTQAEQDAVQRCQLYISPFAHLPREVIGLILKQLIDTSTAKELPNPFIVLHISSGLRQLALGLGFLFKDTSRFLPQSETHNCLSKRQVECLEFCVQKSRGLVTSLEFDHLCSFRLLWVLDVAEASKAILRHLHLPQEGSKYGCNACPDVEGDRKDVPKEVVLSRIIGIITSAAQMEHLDLNLSRQSPKDADLPTSTASQARPTSLKLTTDMYVGRMQSRPKLDSFLKALTSNVTNLSLDIRSVERADQERAAVWTLATRNSQSLREMTLEVDYSYNFADFTPGNFPKLEKLVTLGEWFTRSRTPIRIKAPELKILAAKATSLHLISAPALTLVHLDLDKLKNAVPIAQWLKTVPELERLELRFVSGGRRDMQRDATPDFDDPTPPSGMEDDSLLARRVLATLVPAQNGSVLCPKLHTLGIETSFDCEPDLDWTARRDWSEWIKRETYGEESVDDLHMELAIGGEITRIESQRRRLSQGLEPEEPMKELVRVTPKQVKAKWGECCPLQHLLIRGCFVEEKIWAPLVAADSQLEAVCAPDPMNGKKKRYVRLH